MYPLASQSSAASAHPVEASSMAQTVPTISPKVEFAANDNSAAWKPSLLVQRRRRLNRRAVR
ncbi:hypothetical protein [Henriciella mobilis]|uniref:Uncharacterized protein n=1 Tax=Henriciella mobilis TaxID=2305467 RepID=A0A399R5R9_9PROT|nr:hypothetical protein [Henriciella mobilis]RIJ14867.1 hypothetical protein D1231_14695 [Henriciella mobilis]RIJ21822.1 hypothetical protein D1227_09835 [Henriciella mobilis]RIJ26678.1 hypothetical protein D1223_17160 [Henriciella mobilis]